MAKGVLDELRKQMKQSGVSRYRIAQDTGIDQAALSRFANGQTGLNVSTAETLADYLGLELTLRPMKSKKGN